MRLLKRAKCKEVPESFKDKMQAIVDYNEDDCIATRTVKDWLQEKFS